jgi:hypothetical protein
MSQPVIDIGILTIREDEFRAVLKVFPDEHGIYKGRHREYTLRTTDAGQRARYRLAILRQIEQGNGEAQEAARDLCDDLQPSLFLVVGIAGGLPSDDISLGDVVLSTRVLDFSVEARKFQEETTYSVGGGSIAKSIAAGVANLGARELELGDWWAELPSSRLSVWAEACSTDPRSGSKMCGRSYERITARTSWRERPRSAPGRSLPATGW